MSSPVCTKSQTGLDQKGPQSPPSPRPYHGQGPLVAARAAQIPPSLALGTARDGAAPASWGSVGSASPPS